MPGSNVRVSNRSLFILASTTKLVTSVLVMKAVEEGGLQLTARASDYLDALPAAWRPITISQLLSHADGIPNVEVNARYRALSLGTTEHMSRSDYLSYATEIQLDFALGSRSQYGQTGYILLSVILEKVYGKLYEEITNHIQ